MQFDFGRNWAEFSAHAITPDRVAQARADFGRLMEGIPLSGRTFLDIGFGQGFSLLAAAAGGARVVGCDVNPKCGEVLERNRALFPDLAGRPINVDIGSILNASLVERLRARVDGGYDIVHSWGVLHHTGEMRRAIANAGSLVKPGGWLVIAIYNRHWSSPGWLAIKWTYCNAPGWLQKAIVYSLYPVIWLAKLLVTGKNPKTKERGMDFFYDVVDWVGGYPYEYASVDEVRDICEPLGLALLRANPANVPTGCNEFVFEKPRVPSSQRAASDQFQQAT